MNCPTCESSDTFSCALKLEFKYGVEEVSPTLTAQTTRHECKACGFGWLDSSAEDAKSAAIRTYLAASDGASP